MVLTAEMCQKLFDDVVEDVYVPLRFILRYEPYRYALFAIAAKAESWTSRKDMKAWMTLQSTFELFKQQLVDQGTNLKGIIYDEWLECVVNEEPVLYQVDDWRRGGTFCKSTYLFN